MGIAGKVKHIRKEKEPRAFTDWKNLGNEEWQPTYTALSDQPKSELHDALLREQGYICCYCQRGVTKDDSHIEHFRSQRHYPEQELDYTNLHASCQGIHDKSAPLHCGHAKGQNPAPNTDDEGLIISPLDRYCEGYFRFSGVGEILPSDEPDRKERALRTIAILQLDNSRLTAQRRKAFDAVLSLIDGADFDIIEAEIKNYQKRNAERRFEPFCAAIVYLLKWPRPG
jgi:uncharacterized protein (TIGR02646 family)